MQIVKRVCGVLVAVCLLLTMCVGCSTPAVAMTVDGVDCSTGEYLAHLYNVFYTVYQGQYLYMYETYGLGDPWDKDFTYTKGEETKTLKTADYMKQLAQDSVVRNRAVQKLMEQYGAKLSDEDLANIEQSMASMTDSQCLALGFNKENFRRMVTSTYNEPVLFQAIYGKGGAKEVKEEELRSYFDENYLVYKSVETSLVDSEGTALSDDEVAKVEATMKGYLALYQETGNFDKVLAQYEEDNKSEEEKNDNEGTLATEDSEEGEETTDVNEKAVEIDAATYTDAKFVEALRTVAEGEAKIVTYDKNGTAKTMALILRMDPEGEGRETYYEDSKETILQTMKYETYNDEVEALAATLTVEVSDRAISMCDPKDFEG